MSDATTDANDLPEWLPDEYDPRAPLRERLPVMAGIEGGIELHAQDEHGVEYVLGSPQHFNHVERGVEPGRMKLDAGRGVNRSWTHEVVLGPKSERATLYEVNPDQPVEFYEDSKQHKSSAVDVRIYGVDVERLGDAPAYPVNVGSFFTWVGGLRGPERKAAANESPDTPRRPPTDAHAPHAAVWAREECDDLLDVDGVAITSKDTADGTAPAVDPDEVAGWTKYHLEWQGTDTDAPEAGESA